MQNLDFDTSSSKLVPTSVYHVSKKLVWLVLLVLGSLLTVLLILTIYFGVKQNTQSRTGNTVLTLSTTSASLLGTTTSKGTTTVSTPLPPIARVPDDLQQLSYQLTITPHLANKTFTGEESFV